MGWVRYTLNNIRRWVAFSTFDTKIESNPLYFLPRKSILLTEVGNVQISANGKISVQNVCRSLKRVCTLNDLSRLLATLSHTNL